LISSKEFLTYLRGSEYFIKAFLELLDFLSCLRGSE